MAHSGFVVTHHRPVRSPRRSRRRDRSKKKKSKIGDLWVYLFIYFLIWANGKLMFCQGYICRTPNSQCARITSFGLLVNWVKPEVEFGLSWKVILRKLFFLSVKIFSNTDLEMLISHMSHMSHIRILVHQNGTPIWRLRTMLCKDAWNVAANTSETLGHKDLGLGQIVFILVFYNISFSCLLLLDGFQSTFLLRDSENDL